MSFNVFFEDGSDFREVETDAGDVGVLKGDLDDEIALRGTAVGSGFVFAPRELCGDSHVGASAYACHAAKEEFQANRNSEERSKQNRLAMRGFILRLTRAEAGGEVVPMTEKAAIGHLENSADIRGLVLVEEDVGGGRVAIGSVFASEETERDEGVQEVASGTGMKAEAAR